jgi:ketosteroid isomerase-like protein
MSEQENTKIIQQVYENFNRGDIQSVLNLLSDDVEWQLPEIENVTFAGKRHGREQVAQFFKLLDNAQEVQQFEPQEFITQGDKVVALGHYVWRIKSTGRNFEGDWAHVFTLRDGKIVKFHEHTDTAAAVAAYRKAIEVGPAQNE